MAPPNPPNDPTPSSASFNGDGNVKEDFPKPKCKKGKVRNKKGKCVKKPKKKKRPNGSSTKKNG